METFDIIQLVRYGEVDEILNILDQTVSTKDIFLHKVGPNLHQFIGLAACRGSIEILERCTRIYEVEIKIGSKLGLHAIVGAASRGHDHVVEWLLEQDSNEMEPPQDWLCPSLHKAILGQHVTTVELLVKKGKADVNACDDEKLRPLDVAAVPVDKDNADQISRYEEIIDILVTNGADANVRHPFRETTPLYDAVKLNSHKAMKRLIDGGADVRIPCTKDKRTVLHFVAEAGLAETLLILVDHGRLRKMDPCNFDVRDTNGETPLYAAAYGGHQECIRILIDKGLSLITSTKKSGKASVMDVIFQRIPNPVTFLTEILDEEVTAIDNSGNNIIIDFRLLLSKHSRHWKHKFSDMDVVEALIGAACNIERMAILQHPLLEIFLGLQYLTALPCGLFVFLLQFGLICPLSWYIAHCDEVITDSDNSSGLTMVPLLTFATMISAVNVLFTSIRVKAKMSDNLNTYVSYTVLVITVVNYVYTFTVVVWLESKRRDDIPQVVISAKSIVIMLLWINLMLLSITYPIIGEYVPMFLVVLKNIGKVLFSFIWLIAGFVVVFPTLFPHNNQFDSPWKAVAKTLVMMTGEYEYGSLLSSTDHSNSTFNDTASAEKNNGPQQDVRLFVFLVFVIVCSITLMNLTVGLAVNDIQELRKKGHIRRLITQANWVSVMNYIGNVLGIRISRKLELNLTSRSWITRIKIPAHARKPLYDLALKNYNRELGPRTKSPLDNTQDVLTAIQTSCAAMQSSLRRVEQQLQNCQCQMKRSAGPSP